MTSNGFNPNRDKDGQFANGPKSPANPDNLTAPVVLPPLNTAGTQEEFDASVREAHEAFTALVAEKNEERSRGLDPAVIALRDRAQVVDALAGIKFGYGSTPCLMTDYSGRAMYGEECPAIVVDSEDELYQFHSRLASTNPKLDELLREKSRQDSMGLGIVEYYPGVNLGEGAWPITGDGEEDFDDDDGSTEMCRTEGCDGDPNDGDSYDGYCGNCADRIYGDLDGEDGDTGN